jgi:hypothetical protein
MTATEESPESGVADPPGRRKRSPRRRMVRRVVAAVVLAFLAWLTWSVGSALAAPGTDSVSARLAEWGREHGLGVVVLGLEKLQYRLSPPATGGAPPPGVLPSPSATTAPTSGAHHRGPARSTRIAIRQPMKPFAHPALPGEGTWRSLVTVAGQPAVQAAFLRPDAQHTSYLTGVVWMSSKLLSFRLHPGFDEPGGTWRVPDWIPPGRRRGLAATWNGGFKLADARGGFYLDGKTAGRLVKGAASEVFYRGGTMTVGSWGQEVHMAPDVVGVRQNLVLLIDHGKVRRNINSNPEMNWGLTLGGAYYVFRSGVGITAQGDVVYVSGDALSAQTLALILQRAGCVRAMELDINPAWVSFMSYQPGDHPANPTPKSLLPDYQRPSYRYYTHTSRDFVAAYAR